MKKVKDEYKGKMLSNGNVTVFNTNDITLEMIPFYEFQGFAYLFEDVEVKIKKEVKKIIEPDSQLEKIDKQVKKYLGKKENKN